MSRKEEDVDDLARACRASDMQDIRDALMRYCRGIDRGDEVALASAYHDDATEHHGPFEGRVADFIPFVIDILKTLEVSMHMILNVLIELDGDVAASEAYFIAIQREGGADVEDHIGGRYLDRFERRNGEWRIAHRLVVLDWSRRDPYRGPSPYEPLASFRTAARGPADPLYEVRASIFGRRGAAPRVSPVRS